MFNIVERWQAQACRLFYWKMNAQDYQALLKDFVERGGAPRMAQRLGRFSLQNWAKLQYELSKLKPAPETPTATPTETQEPPQTPPKPKVFNDLISDYPVVLHATYRRRWEVWLAACSWKMQLNNISPIDADRAFEVQLKIYRLFLELDQCQKILRHYQEHKRVMPTQSAVDFSAMSELECYKYRNKLRASITRRRQTISALEKALPSPEERHYTIRLHSLNRKREQLQDKLNELHECEKFLDGRKDWEKWLKNLCIVKIYSIFVVLKK